MISLLVLSHEIYFKILKDSIFVWDEESLILVLGSFLPCLTVFHFVNYFKDLKVQILFNK